LLVVAAGTNLGEPNLGDHRVAGFTNYLPPALAKPRMRLYALGHGVSVLGGWIQQVALSWLIFRLSGSVFLLGFSGFIQMIPFLLLGPVTGVVVDRLPRLKLLIAIDAALACCALTLAILSANGVTDVRIYLVIAGLAGILNAFEMPTRQSLLSEIVDDRALMPSALALSATLFNSGRMIGPAIAGLLLMRWPETWCFLLNAVSYAAIIAALIAMRLPEKPRAKSGTEQQRQGILKSFQHLTRLPPVQFLLPIVITVGLCAVPYIHLMPSIATTFFGGGSGTVGALLSMSGVGAVLAAGFLSMQKTSAIQIRALAFVPTALGLALIAVASTRHLALGLVLMAIMGACIVICANATNILLQQSVPDAWRGRVIGLYAMAFQGMGPIGNLLTGTVAEHIGLGPALTINGLIILAVALATRWRFQQQPDVLAGLGQVHPAE
jgi:MFS family permease